MILPFDFRNDLVQPATINQLHRVEEVFVFLADFKHRHDIGVVHLRRCASFPPETGLRVGRSQLPQRQHLDRDSTTERNLFGFVNDTHPAANDFANDAIVANLVGPVQIGFDFPIARLRSQVFHHVERIKQFAQLVREFRVLLAVFIDAGIFTVLSTVCVLIDDVHQALFCGGIRVHGHMMPGESTRDNVSGGRT